MPMITRASLGAEFEDRTSPRLLAQPEPQYLYAQLWKMAIQASEIRAAGGDLAWRAPAIGTDGAPYPSAMGLRAIFDDPIFRDAFVNVTELSDQGKGHTIRMNRPLFANTTYTQASRELPNGTSISTVPINLGSEQVSLTTKRWGGPYDQTNGNVAPYGVDRFDANKAIHSTAEMVGGQLQRDFDRTIDTFIGAYLSLGATSVYTGGYSATTSFYGGATTGGINASGYGEAPLSFNAINQLEYQADGLNLPVFPDGTRALVVPPIGLLELKDDPQWLKMVEFHPPVNPVLAQSYWRTFGRTHIFKSTTVPSTTNGHTGQTVYQGQYFCPGVLGSGISEMPRVARSASDNFGEWALVIWLMYAAFGLLDSRFALNLYFN
jgi:hypothetical protein